MPDHFFEGGSRKRKRASSTRTRPTASRNRQINGVRKGKAAAGGQQSTRDGDMRVGGRSNGGSKVTAASAQRRAKLDQEDDEELDNDEEDDDGGGDSDAADVNSARDTGPDTDEELDARETAGQKRLRLAKQYLESLKADQPDIEGIDAAQLERDYINDRLQKDVLEVSGKLHLRLASTLSFSHPTIAWSSTKVHRLPITCAAASQNCRSLFTCSKDGSIARYDIAALTALQPVASTSTLPAPTNARHILKTDLQLKRRTKQGKRVKKDGKSRVSKSALYHADDKVRGHTNELYTLSVSTDGTRLATGGKDRRVGIWDISSTDKGKGCQWIKGLSGHRDSIGSLKFRLGTSQVYSSSFDRSVKIFDAMSLTYVETLYGHQDQILDLDILRNELAVTAGARDKTVRYWKVRDESQLVLRAGTTSKIRRMLEGGVTEDFDDAEPARISSKPSSQITNGNASLQPTERKFIEGSADCAAMIDDQHFISGGDSGTISLWTISKKKPIYTLAVAHGFHETHSETEGLLQEPHWITALATLPYSDLFVSGSWDGKLRFWRIAEDMRSFEAVGELTAVGVVNSLQLLQLPGSKRKQNRKPSTECLNKPGGVLLVAAIAKEHKFGRWLQVGAAKDAALLAILSEVRSA